MAGKKYKADKLTLEQTFWIGIKMNNEDLYLEQILVGPMENFVYLKLKSTREVAHMILPGYRCPFRACEQARPLN